MGNIYLVGFMGTGKSAVGRKLAKVKKRRFVDLDELIELSAKKIISDIFANDGELHFRSLEKRALKEVAARKGLVVACGGGIVIDKDNIKIMKDTGVVICLKASPKIILERTSGYTHRPLLKVADPKKEIGLLLKKRSAYYARVDKSIETSKLSLREVVNAILKFLDQNKSHSKSRR
ncbi:MAG: shikimate kinase [Candidatus Omnitrophota bacterium]